MGKVIEFTGEYYTRQKRSKELNEDDSKKLHKTIQDCTDKFVKSVDEKVKQKETEILSCLL